MKIPSDMAQDAVLRAIEVIRDVDGSTAPKYDAIASRAKCSVTTVKRSLHYLELHGRLQVTRHPGLPNVYRVLTSSTVTQVPRTYAEVPSTYPEVPRTEVPRTYAEVPRTYAEVPETQVPVVVVEEIPTTPPPPGNLSGQDSLDFKRFKDAYTSSVRPINNHLQAAVAAWRELSPPIDAVLVALKHDVESDRWGEVPIHKRARADTWLREERWKMRPADQPRKPSAPVPPWGGDNNMKYIPWGDMAL